MANDALVAHSSTVIAASPDLIWRALVDPVAIKRYMFGTTVTSDWTEGGDIIWEGEWQGRPYRDHGKVLRIEPDRLLEYTHFSPLAGKPDVPENYHTVTIRLAPCGRPSAVAAPPGPGASRWRLSSGYGSGW